MFLESDPLYDVQFSKVHPALSRLLFLPLASTSIVAHERHRGRKDMSDGRCRCKLVCVREYHAQIQYVLLVKPSGNFILAFPKNSPPPPPPSLLSRAFTLGLQQCTLTAAVCSYVCGCLSSCPGPSWSGYSRGVVPHGRRLGVGVVEPVSKREGVRCVVAWVTDHLRKSIRAHQHTHNHTRDEEEWGRGKTSNDGLNRNFAATRRGEYAHQDPNVKTGRAEKAHSGEIHTQGRIRSSRGCRSCASVRHVCVGGFCGGIVGRDGQRHRAALALDADGFLMRPVRGLALPGLIRKKEEEIRAISGR